jgi:hypothetical protein
MIWRTIKVSTVVALVTLGSALHAEAATLTFDSVQFPGTGVPLSVVGSDGVTFTFTAGPSSQFEAFQSGGAGSFPAGAFFLAPGLGNTTPIDIAFSSPITSFSIPVSSDRTGDSPYTSTVQLFDGSTRVESITLSGNTLNAPLVFTASGVFTSAVVSTLVPVAPFGFTQNIGSLSYSTAQAVPGPVVGAGLPGLLAGFGAMLAWRRKRRAAV